MNIINITLDKRSECISILACMKLQDYKAMVYQSFSEGGNLNGQRDVIKRSSVASKIRKRMNDDFIAGAIFPPVVIGYLVNEMQFKNLKDGSLDFSNIELKSDAISIIDGMQRSNIYFSNYEGNEDNIIRIEFWISNKSIKMLYRMLVLNTGQVPWNTRRQVEVIFSNLSNTIINSVFSKYEELNSIVEIISVDDKKRRTQSGKYHKSTMIEMFLGFNTRSVKVDVSDELANEFQKFDMMEAIEKDYNFELFVETFAYLCKLDIALSNSSNQSKNGQFKEGKDLFGSAPVCLGFVVACAEFIMGKIPIERDIEIKKEKCSIMKSKLDQIIKLSVQVIDKDNDFLSLDTLNDIMTQLPKNRIGDEMRILFKSIFTELLRYEDLDEILTLEAFWRS